MAPLLATRNGGKDPALALYVNDEFHFWMYRTLNVSGAFLGEGDGGTRAWGLAVQVERHPRGCGVDIVSHLVVIF